MDEQARERQIKYGQEEGRAEAVAALWEMSKEGEAKGKTRYRLGLLACLFLLISGGITDLLTLIPIVGTVIGPIYWFLVGLYLWKKGFGLLNWRRIVPGLISLVAELIPAVQELPTIIIGVAVIIIFSRFEDRTGIKVIPQIKMFPKKPPVMGRRPPPYNQNEARLPRKQ